jgi:N-acetylneuraminic acid mutarotase
MSMIIVLCILLIILLAGCSVPEQQNDLIPCSAIPSERACATCFVYGGQAYLFGGRSRDADGKEVYLNDLWRYDPATDAWTSLGSTPLLPRVNATACVADGAVYMGLGYAGSGYYLDSTYLRDWYRYEPETGTFVALAPYPNGETDKAISWAFEENGEATIYAGYGFRTNYTRDIFRYDIAADRWDSIDTQVSYMGYPSRCFGATGVVWHNRLFGGTGYRRFSLNWWAELVPEGKQKASWRSCSAVPSPERTLSACAATDAAIYVAGGMHYGGLNTTGKVLQDVLRYNPDADRWMRVATLPEPLCNHVMFRIGSDVYIGSGEAWRNDRLVITPNFYRLHEQ